MSTKGLFIVITHTRSVNPDSRSSEDAFLITEKCDFVDKLTSGMLASATVALNYTNKTVVKNRDNDSSFNTLMLIIESKYKKELEDFKYAIGE